jgi:hypothetical protein
MDKFLLMENIRTVRLFCFGYTLLPYLNSSVEPTVPCFSTSFLTWDLLNDINIFIGLPSLTTPSTEEYARTPDDFLGRSY